MNNTELIDLLEKEMLDDIKSIDIPEGKTGTIKIELVKQWYFETEKIIRVLANILSVPMNQAINQLRYAGHHILKAQNNSKVSKENLNEAFKHCKRAIYDSLDFYVYTLNERYSVVMPLLDTQNAIKLEGLLKAHIIEINNCRAECGARMDYYSGVQNTLIYGLRLIEQINEIQRETGVAKELFAKKKALFDENQELKKHLHVLKNRNDVLETKITNKLYNFSLWMGLDLTFAVIVGLMVGNHYITTTHEVKFVDNIQKTPTEKDINNSQ